MLESVVVEIRSKTVRTDSMSPVFRQCQPAPGVDFRPGHGRRQVRVRRLRGLADEPQDVRWALLHLQVQQQGDPQPGAHRPRVAQLNTASNQLRQTNCATSTETAATAWKRRICHARDNQS